MAAMLEIPATEGRKKEGSGKICGSGGGEREEEEDIPGISFETFYFLCKSSVAFA